MLTVIALLGSGRKKHTYGAVKVFLDRLGFVFHRPRFFGRASTSIVCQGVYGGGSIVKYFHFISNAMGFNAVKGVSLNTREPVTEKARKKTDAKLKKLGRKYYAVLSRKALPRPSLFELMMFRISRSRIQTLLDTSFRDYTWFRDQGWFSSAYYYPVRLSPWKKAAGWLFDVLGRKKKPRV